MFTRYSNLHLNFTRNNLYALASLYTFQYQNYVDMELSIAV